MKRYHTGKPMETGVLWTGTGPTTVKLACMFTLPKTKEEFKSLPEAKYESIDAMLADGWLID